MKFVLAKILKFQMEVDAIPKTETNPFFHSKYADINSFIEAIKPVLNKVGLVVLQPLTNIDGKPAINTIIADPESGEIIESVLPLIENSDPQKFGSICTYTRRYALQSILLLQSEDDDGNTASEASIAFQGSKTAPVPKSSPTEPFESVPASQLCPKCGAKMAVSKTKGTLYCSKLCWK